MLGLVGFTLTKVTVCRKIILITMVGRWLIKNPRNGNQLE